MSTARRPAAAHMRGWLASGAGIDDAPGSASPSASVIAIMVAAVPITMQVPNEREMPPSISFHSSSPMRPARFSSQYFQASEPGAQDVAAPIAAQHRPGRHIDRRDAHADRAHDEAGRRLVAAAHQNRAVDRMAAQQLFAFHGEEIAVEHGRRFDEGLGKRHRRQLDRKSAGLIDAALHVLGAGAQMAMAGVDLAPGIDDADHRLADPIGAVIAELPQPRAMAERAQIVLAEPAIAAQLFGQFSFADVIRRRSPWALSAPSVRSIQEKRQTHEEPCPHGPPPARNQRCLVQVIVDADAHNVIESMASDRGAARGEYGSAAKGRIGLRIGSSIIGGRAATA